MVDAKWQTEAAEIRRYGSRRVNEDSGVIPALLFCADSALFAQVLVWVILNL
jgi:hypothetical protein